MVAYLRDDIDGEVVQDAYVAVDPGRGWNHGRSQIPVTCFGQVGIPKSLKRQYLGYAHPLMVGDCGFLILIVAPRCSRIRFLDDPDQFHRPYCVRYGLILTTVCNGVNCPSEDALAGQIWTSTGGYACQ